jgi:hypothetical protein
LDELIRNELSRAADLPSREIKADAIAKANQLFLDLVN